MLDTLPDSVYANIVDIQKKGEWFPLIVHGGGPLISSTLKQLNIESQFINGLRVTTEEVLNIVEMVLSGSVNKHISRKLMLAGGQAWGVSGTDGMLLEAKPTSKDAPLGFVGNVKSVNQRLLKQISDMGIIPVISPLGIDKNGQRYNINADTAAAAIAKSLNASLCMLTNVSGIYEEQGDEKIYYHQLTESQTLTMIANGTIHGGMIPKVESAIEALKEGIPNIVILNGLEKNTLLDFAKGKPIGTTFLLEEKMNYV